MGFDVKITTFSGILNLLAPHSCRGCGRLGVILCECCKKYNIKSAIRICARCKKPYSKCKCKVPIYTVAWREGLMRDLIEEYKYQSIRATADILAEMIDAVIPRQSDGSNIDWENVVVVPLPTIGRHIRERGFDHTLLMAKKLAKRRGWMVQQVLGRRGKTVQVGADEKTRKAQARKAYEVVGKIDNKKTYLLLDDVWTTGASMETAISLMRDAGAEMLAGMVVVTSR